MATAGRVLVVGCWLLLVGDFSCGVFCLLCGCELFLVCVFVVRNLVVVSKCLLSADCCVMVGRCVLSGARCVCFVGFCVVWCVRRVVCNSLFVYSLVIVRCLLCVGGCV